MPPQPGRDAVRGRRQRRPEVASRTLGEPPERAELPCPEVEERRAGLTHPLPVVDPQRAVALRDVAAPEVAVDRAAAHLEPLEVAQQRAGRRATVAAADGRARPQASRTASSAAVGVGRAPRRPRRLRRGLLERSQPAERSRLVTRLRSRGQRVHGLHDDVVAGHDPRDQRHERQRARPRRRSPSRAAGSPRRSRSRAAVAGRTGARASP